MKGISYDDYWWHYTVRNNEAWNKRHAMRRAVEAGATQVSIARDVGLSQSRVNQMVNRAFSEHRQNKPSPMEAYLARSVFPIERWRSSVRAFCNATIAVKANA